MVGSRSGIGLDESTEVEWTWRKTTIGRVRDSGSSTSWGGSVHFVLFAVTGAGANTEYCEINTRKYSHVYTCSHVYTWKGDTTIHTWMGEEVNIQRTPVPDPKCLETAVVGHTDFINVCYLIGELVTDLLVYPVDVLLGPPNRGDRYDSYEGN